MSYTITKTDGSTLATVSDGTVNATSTSLTLIGKNYAGYGIFLNTNFVSLLENFANGTEPAHPLIGQIWYDSGNKLLKVYDSSGVWKTVSSSAASATAPSSAIAGDLWWDTANSQLKVYSGTAWVIIGPAYTGASGTSGAIVESIKDSLGNNRIIVKFYISSSVIAILAKESFTPFTAIPGFTTISPGLNLVSSSTLANSRFYGDASNALTLQGTAASGFMRKTADEITDYAITAKGGLTAGTDLTLVSGTSNALKSTTNNKDLSIFVKKANVDTAILTITGSTGKVALSNDLQVAGAGTFTGAVSMASTLAVTGQVTLSNKLVPNANNTLDLGASGTKFNNVYATNLKGNADTATKLAAAVTINGTSFDGSAGITVTAAAGTLTGSSLNTGVTSATGLTAVGTLVGLNLAAGTTSVPSLKLASGVILTSAQAGAIEYDTYNFYATGNTTNGRGELPVEHYVRLNTNLAAVGPSVANFFGSSAGIPLVTNSVYEIEFNVFYTKSSPGNITYTLSTGGSAVANMVSTLIHGTLPSASIGQYNIAGSTTANPALNASAIPTVNSTSYSATIRILLENGSATNCALQITQTAGTIVALRGSTWKARKLATGTAISGNMGANQVGLTA
jgi:hypothetical protein